MSKAKVTTVGDRVKLKALDKSKANLLGVVRFVGQIQGKKSVFFGVELDDAKGKNTGSVKKVPYFKCARNEKKGLFCTQTGIAETNSTNNADAPRITVGDKVKCKKQKCNGTVRFIGTPYSIKDEGVFYGVELDEPKGKNNGTVKDRWYFTCEDKFGAFCAASGIAALGADKGDKKAKKDDAKEDKKGDKKGTKEKTEKAKPKKEEEKKEEIVYKVGDRVMVKPDKEGQIKYIGESKELGSGVHYGIRLTEKRGDCDGEWKGMRKFQCPVGFGLYVPLRYLVKPVEGDFDFMNEEEKYEEDAKSKAEY